MKVQQFNHIVYPTGGLLPDVKKDIRMKMGSKFTETQGAADLILFVREQVV